MPKAAKDEAPWLDALKIDKVRRLIAMWGGFVVLCEEADGSYSLWLYAHCLATGSRKAMRSQFADMMRGDWLEPVFRR